MSKKIEFHFKRPSDSPGYLLGQLTMLWQRKQKKVLDPLDLTSTQFVLLASLGWLSKSSNSVTQVDIASQANLDRMMVSKVLRTLEGKGFVTRQEHEKDTRAKTIELTNKGAEILQTAIVVVENADIEFFSTIEKDLPFFNLKMVELIEKYKE